jgi:hypothetical protein
MTRVGKTAFRLELKDFFPEVHVVVGAVAQLALPGEKS